MPDSSTKKVPARNALPVYLDYAATTPVDVRVAAKMIPHLTEMFGNPASRSHAYGWAADEAVELAREQVCALIGADPREIVRASGMAAGFLLPSLSTTSNPTQLDAGYKQNVIPDTASAVIDIRPLPGTEDEVLAQIRSIIGPDIELSIQVQDVGLENDFDTPIVDAMKRTLSAADPGAVMLPYLLSGGTDNKALSLIGITGYGFAPLRLPADMDFPGMFHGVDERVPLDALDFGHRVLTDFLRTY